MKICFLIRSLHYGGAEQQLICLANGLANKNYDITIITFYSNGVLEKRLDKNINLISLNKKGRWNIISFIYKLVRLIRSIKPDILHGYLLTANLLTLLSKVTLKNTKIIWGVRSSYVGLNAYDWLAKLLFSLSCRLSYFADRIISNSYAGMEFHVKQGYPRDRFTCIPNGIDVKRFKYCATAGKKIRDELMLSTETFLIGMVARYDPIKGHMILFNAIKNIIENNANVKLLLVGSQDNNYFQKLQKSAYSLDLQNHIIWYGSTYNIEHVYPALDLFILPSISEGFPNTLVEAMSSSLFCITTNVGDTKLIANKLATIVPPKNIELLEMAIVKAINMPIDIRQQYGIDARSHIVNNYSKEILIEKTDFIFNEICC